jgi:hypothetical protein
VKQIHLLAGAIALVLATGGGIGIRIATASGQADFCYVESIVGTGSNYIYPQDLDKQVWKVRAHRPWRQDLTLGLAPTLEEAIGVAERAKCPLYTEKR